MSIEIQKIESGWKNNPNPFTIPPAAKKSADDFNKTYQIGSFFIDKITKKLVITTSPAKATPKGKVFVKYDTVNGCGYENSELNELDEPNYIALLREFLESPENDTVELNNEEFRNIEKIYWHIRDCQKNDRFAYQGVEAWQENDWMIVFGVGGKVIEYINMDERTYEEDEEGEDWDEYQLQNEAYYAMLAR